MILAILPSHGLRHLFQCSGNCLFAIECLCRRNSKAPLINLYQKRLKFLISLLLWFVMVNFDLKYFKFEYVSKKWNRNSEDLLERCGEFDLMHCP